MNIGMLFRWGSVIMNMVNDPNIHMIARGAWTGIRKLRTAKDPTLPPQASTATPAMPGLRQLPAVPNMPPSPDVPATKGFPGGPGMGRMPSEAEIKKMLQDPRVKRMLNENPQMRRMLEDPKLWPVPSNRSIQRIPGMFGSPHRAEFIEQEGLNGQFPFPWMQQQSNMPRNKRRRQGAKKRGF